MKAFPLLISSPNKTNAHADKMLTFDNCQVNGIPTA